MPVTLVLQAAKPRQLRRLRTTRPRRPSLLRPARRRSLPRPRQAAGWLADLSRVQAAGSLITQKDPLLVD